ncbi:hypothetical protein AB0F24_19900 [Streptomyces platensis]|uniref:hypothetical protein n=1 Tax=Streptomyces platensis TaxID=58346 RepID=UPI0033C7DD53
MNLGDGGRTALEAHAATLQRIVEESRRTAGGDGDQGVSPWTYRGCPPGRTGGVPLGVPGVSL